MAGRGRMVGAALAGIAALTLAGEPAAAGPAPGAAGWEVRLGVLKHDVDDLWSGFGIEDGIDYSAELILGRPAFDLLGGVVRPNLGIALNDSGDTSQLYGGLLWEVRLGSRLFLDLGLGAALHDGELNGSRDRKALGSRLLFRVPIELGVELTDRLRAMVSFAHVSNAFLADENEGLDTLGLRLGYRFP